MSNENQKEISEAFYKLMTLNGQFDFTKVVTTLIESKVQSEREIKKTPPAPELTKPIFDDGRGGYKMSACAKMWRRWAECVQACVSPQSMRNKCPNCSDYPPLGEECCKTPPKAPIDEPQFPCCDDCVSAKCIVATGNEDCIMGGAVNEPLLLVAQLSCYQDTHDAWEHEFNCWACYSDEYLNCFDFPCTVPNCPPVTIGEMFPEMLEEIERIRKQWEEANQQREQS